MSETLVKLTRKDFVSEQEVRWCPGCGDYAILAQVQKVMPEIGIPREKIVFVSGIGCSSRFPYYMATYGFHGIHGRAPAIATGIKTTNPELSVWVVTGDGDALSIGGNHLIHTLRRNVDVKILLFNNRIYGLTKGQYSPTSEFGKKTKSSPFGTVDRPFNPLSVALAAEATFVARTIDSEVKHMQEVIAKAAEHKGGAFVEIYQNCMVFNDEAFDFATNRETKAETQLVLEHGQPLLFGKDRKKGIRMKEGFQPEVAQLDDPGIDAATLIRHDASRDDPAYAFMLSRLEYPEFPVPVGVLRAVRKPTYDELLADQAKRATAAKGEGDLQKLLYSGDTYRIEPPRRNGG
ncbi:MAG: 2-oxoacid:ferredoxin oxidoreductase subunit beta [Deltaproteobacteria bacterium]|nr:2-oxoacid:ferredoxin oxidoreductase subunit beta [Deltaproteobacteria bacterium]